MRIEHAKCLHGSLNTLILQWYQVSVCCYKVGPQEGVNICINNRPATDTIFAVMNSFHLKLASFKRDLHVIHIVAEPTISKSILLAEPINVVIDNSVRASLG